MTRHSAKPKVSLPREIWDFLHDEVFGKANRRNTFIGSFGMFIGLLAATWSLHSLTEGLAWIDKSWETATAAMAIGAGMATFTLVVAWTKYRTRLKESKPAGEAASEEKGECSRNVAALIACFLAALCFGAYLWTYHRCIVTLDDHARQVLHANAAADDTAATQPAPESAATPDRLCLPLILPEEIRMYNDGIVQNNKRLATGGKQTRAGISVIISQDPQWLFDKLEHDYPHQVAWTKLLLFGIYLMVFALVGLAAGLSFQPIESAVQIFTGATHRA
jgi:hypothetical protein